MKATNLIFGVILASLVVGAFGLFINDMATTYEVANWSDSDMALFNKLNETETMAYELQATTNLTADPSFTDIVGLYVGKAVSSLKITFTSMGSATDMVSIATDKLKFPGMFKTALITMLIIALVLGVIISAMVQRDL